MLGFIHFAKMSKKERKGWKWVGTDSSGYWAKVEEENSHRHKKDFFCKHCRKITGTIDDPFTETLGICAACYVRFVETRQNPVIDLSKYAKIDISGLDLSNKGFLKDIK